MFATVLAIALGLQQHSEPPTETAARHPLTRVERSNLRARLQKQIASADSRLRQSSSDQTAVSERGDASFFLGKFADAVRDYDRMVELNPRIDRSHWQRGIALFYAGQFDKATAQFERYHSYDNVDRENGIWRYLCQRKSKGLRKARAGLLKYEKDDREPFPSVYKLFAGEMKPEQVLKSIADAEISAVERDKRTFYAELYIGLNEVVENRPKSARSHLAKAVATKWPRTAGYGPNYMWHVGRVQLDLLDRRRRKNAAEKPDPSR